jgi:hypothetical protein
MKKLLFTILMLLTLTTVDANAQRYQQRYDRRKPVKTEYQERLEKRNNAYRASFKNKHKRDKKYLAKNRRETLNKIHSSYLSNTKGRQAQKIIRQNRYSGR